MRAIGRVLKSSGRDFHDVLGALTASSLNAAAAPSLPWNRTDAETLLGVARACGATVRRVGDGFALESAGALLPEDLRNTLRERAAEIAAYLSNHASAFDADGRLAARPAKAVQQAIELIHMSLLLSQ